ncbi:MAG: hypothetical protein KKD63_13200 [Proteobacteria bacterium]|nr:hypothetical protein [Pseudomonadota bacterium]MDP2105963.1 hypothetical protein [Desulfobulbaceae bacterium]
MTHHKKHQHTSHAQAKRSSSLPATDHNQVLELVIKGDTGDIVEAVVSSLLALSGPECHLAIIRQGVGNITKNDLLTAATGSRLIIGFNVEVLQHIAEECRVQSIDIRLYTVIYTLIEDMRRLVANLIPVFPVETVTGNARVIALFKSSRKGIIIGCQVLDGRICLGNTFRLISAMGPVYFGTIDSLHIERESVKQALPGQQVGIKVHNFKRVNVGDLVECLKISKVSTPKTWKPTGTVTTITSL